MTVSKSRCRDAAGDVNEDLVGGRDMSHEILATVNTDKDDWFTNALRHMPVLVGS